MAEGIDLSSRRTDGPAMPKIGLVLGSGVARGWAHIGVLRALEKLGVEPDIVVGCSIGAVVGGLHLAGKLNELEAWARDLTKLKIVSYLDLRVRSGGIIGGSRLHDELYKYIGGAQIEDLPKRFAAVTTDMVTGHEIWLEKGDLANAIQASFSLPGVFPPIRVDRRWLLDGALVDPVPVSVARAMGAEMVIAVNLNADLLGKVRRPDMSVPTVTGFDLTAILDEQQKTSTPVINRGNMLDSFSKRLFRREADGPSLFGVMVNTINIMQDRVGRARLAGDPPDVMITPRLGHVGLLEFDRAHEAIAEGEAAVSRAEAELGDAFRVFFRKSNA